MASFDYDETYPDQLGNDVGFRRHLLSIGREVQQGIARQLPVGRTGGRRVAPFAKRSFTAIDGAGRQVEVTVGTKWRVAPIIEWGTIHSPAYAPVRKAAMAAGLHLTGGGK